MQTGEALQSHSATEPGPASQKATRRERDWAMLKAPIPTTLHTTASVYPLPNSLRNIRHVELPVAFSPGSVVPLNGTSPGTDHTMGARFELGETARSPAAASNTAPIDPTSFTDRRMQRAAGIVSCLARCLGAVALRRAARGRRLGADSPPRSAECVYWHVIAAKRDNRDYVPVFVPYCSKYDRWLTCLLLVASPLGRVPSGTGN